MLEDYQKLELFLPTTCNCGQVNFVKLIEISIIIFAIRTRRKIIISDFIIDR
ncbi:hypothetical protein WH47_01726 [Habropoda laboriosa]|uniref:Uncharacterized protein n=1 Tax=Habropoda laboriosa TaxID=597456 RepID=A0A0L7RJV7_9HYME|nr:hypothetical protein WH47_01726 [Habropoda laboriosa]